MAFWMLPLALAAAGAFIDKKKPLRGALIGGLTGATGGLLAPEAAAAGTTGALTTQGATGLLGTAGANAAGYGVGATQFGGVLAAPEIAAANATTAAYGPEGMNLVGNTIDLPYNPATGVYDSFNGLQRFGNQLSSGFDNVKGLLGDTEEYLKPAMNVGKAMQTANSLMPQDEPIQPSPITPPTYSTTLPELVSQNTQLDMQRADEEMKRRMAQRQRVQNMGVT